MSEDTTLRSRIMRAVKGSDTAPEMYVRRMVHGLGFRYGLHSAKLPGKPDLVLTSRRKIIFVHGCFWHGHKCARGNRAPKVNATYWHAKIAGNQARDRTTKSKLKAAGWRVLVVWECETKKQKALTQKLVSFLKH